MKPILLLKLLKMASLLVFISFQKIFSKINCFVNLSCWHQFHLKLAIWRIKPILQKSFSKCKFSRSSLSRWNQNTYTDNSQPSTPPYFIYHDYKIHGSILSIIKILVIHGSSISIKTVKRSFQYCDINGFQYLVLLKKLFLYEVQEGFQFFLSYHKDPINPLLNF